MNEFLSSFFFGSQSWKHQKATQLEKDSKDRESRARVHFENKRTVPGKIARTTAMFLGKNYRKTHAFDTRLVGKTMIKPWF